MQSRYSALSVILRVSVKRDSIVYDSDPDKCSTIIIIMFHQGTYNVPNHVQISGYGNVDLP